MICTLTLDRIQCDVRSSGKVANHNGKRFWFISHSVGFISFFHLLHIRAFVFAQLIPPHTTKIPNALHEQETVYLTQNKCLHALGLFLLFCFFRYFVHFTSTWEYTYRCVFWRCIGSITCSTFNRITFLAIAVGGGGVVARKKNSKVGLWSLWWFVETQTDDYHLRIRVLQLLNLLYVRRIFTAIRPMLFSICG